MMSVSSLQADARSDTASPLQSEVARRTVDTRWRAIQLLDGDTITLVLIVVLVAGSFWFGQKSRETAPGACSTNPPSMEFVPELNVAMTVKSGAACAIWARVMTPFVDALDIETPPLHGTLRTRGLSGVIYRPEKGYLGDDVFVFTRRGASQFHKGDSLVRVDVNVE